MIAKISRGAGFLGLLDYALDTDGKSAKDAERVGGSLSGKTPRQLAAEFSATRQLRPDIRRPA